MDVSPLTVLFCLFFLAYRSFLLGTFLCYMSSRHKCESAKPTPLPKKQNKKISKKIKKTNKGHDHNLKTNMTNMAWEMWKCGNVAGLMQNAVIFTNTTWPFLTLLQRDSFKTPGIWKWDTLQWKREGFSWYGRRKTLKVYGDPVHGNHHFPTEAAGHGARTSPVLFISKREMGNMSLFICPFTY